MFQLMSGHLFHLSIHIMVSIKLVYHQLMQFYFDCSGFTLRMNTV